MNTQFTKRLYSVKEQNKDIRKLSKHGFAFMQSKYQPVISKIFSETLSLAVSQVNGCSLCSYAHTKTAMKAGMSEEEVNLILTGGLEKTPKEQRQAVLFAQHYADTHGNPDPELSQKLLDTYGYEKSKDIMSPILLMMVTNIHGNTMEAFKLRLSGKAVTGSSFWRELGVIINIVRLAPIMLFKLISYKSSPRTNRV